MLLKAGLEVPVKKRIGSSLEPIQKDKGKCFINRLFKIID